MLTIKLYNGKTETLLIIYWIKTSKLEILKNSIIYLGKSKPTTIQ